MEQAVGSAPQRASVIEWSVAARTHPRESESGDLYLVKVVPGGVLVAVVDGLGHGPEAAVAARTAVAAIESYAHQPVVAVMRVCHTALQGTRGVVATIVHFDEATGKLSWIAVGNVEGVLLGPSAHGTLRREVVLARGGVVGFQLPSLASAELALQPGDLVVLATDGLREDFARSVMLHDALDVTAARVMNVCATGTDDALVLVVRYVGSAP